MFALLVARVVDTAQQQQAAEDFPWKSGLQGTPHIAGARVGSNEKHPRAAARVTGFFRAWHKSITTTGSLCHW